MARPSNLVKKPQGRNYYTAPLVPDVLDQPPPPDEPPADRSEVWRKFYVHCIEVSKALGTDSWTDLPGLCEICDIHEEVQRLKMLLKNVDGKDEFTSMGSSSEVVNPVYRALLNIRPLYHKLLSDFGMTPRGRASMVDKRKTNSSKARSILQELNDDTI